jgi:isorenieratene synthase
VSEAFPGRDRRAVRHRAALPGPHRPDRPTVAIVGGGVAGLAAATALAERGVAVTLIEREDTLGGRVRAWPVEHAGGATMSRGFHAFFRQYYNLRALLRRADPALDRLRPAGDYPLLAASGARDSFARIPRTPPWSFVGFVLRSETFPLRALAHVDVAAAMELLDVRFPETLSAYDGESAAAFLDRLGFPDEARHLALEVFARSFFAQPDDFSAGELVSMFHTYFLGSAEGLLFDVPEDDYDTALWSPLVNHLQSLGVTVRAGEPALATRVSEDRVEVETAADSVHADGLVLATDPRSSRRLIASCNLGDAPWRERVAATRNAPPFAVWRLWLREPVHDDRPAFLGTAGFDLLDNVSVLERFEAGAAGWVARHGGSVVELHAYALPEPVDTADVQRRLRAALATVYPETARAGVVADEWLLRDDCPLIDTSPWRDRPGVVTSDPRVVVAGDWVRCDYPVALMERAATTGVLAANALLRRFGREGHDIWTVPMAGRHRVAAPLHRWVARPEARRLLARDRPSR